MPPAFVVACWPTIENTATAFGLRVTFSRIVMVPVTVAGSASTWTAGRSTSATSAIETSADSLRSMRLLCRRPVSNVRLQATPGARTRTSRDLGETGRRLQSPAMAVYLDHAATTPLRPEALEAMLPFLGGTFGNPSSTHAFGRVAREALDDAHERLARSIGADAREIVFTSGGTEANNLALKGAAWAGRARGHRIVTTPVEHHAIGHTLEHLQKFGFEVVEVPVDRYGRVDPEEVERAITDRTILVTVMLANNEVGTIQPVAEVAEVVRARRGLLFHVDAVQAAPGSTSTSTPSARTSSRWRRTRPRARRAPGRCGSGAARTSWPSSTADRRSATGAPAPRTWPAPSGWPRRSSCGPRSGRRSSRRSEPGATVCWRR